MTAKTILTVLWVVLWGFLTEYLFMPTFTLTESSDLYWNLIIFSAVLAIIWYRYSDEEFSIGSGIFSGISGILFIILVVFGFASCGACRANKFQKILGDVKQTEFTANIQPVAADQMLIVDKEIAERIGEKELGSDPGLGSRCELGDFALQAVKGKLYWIAPLEHSGFWKWNGFSEEGTPGYIRVSATNQEDYALVKNVDGKDLHIKYQTNAYFSQDLSRHIYTSGYRSSLYSDLTFEVDDEWRPYWTVTLSEARVGFRGKDAIGVLTVDPETGDIKKYSIAEAPAWIDRIQPEDFVNTQIDDWGKYIHGWWNWSHKDVLRVVDESSVVLGHDGRAYYYFGLKSSGSENSTVGFMMVDTRTKQTHWFKQSGATENAAKKSAEGKVQQMNYVGSDGITYNIDGHATYEFLLKDKGGLMKLVALVNVHDHNIVGVGESRHHALQDYRSTLANRGNAISIATSDMEKVTVMSKVNRFAFQIVKGNTYYYLTLDEKPSTIFMAGITISNELPLTKEGDRVKVSYIKENSQQELSLITFDNLNLGILKDSMQVKNEANLDSVRIQKIDAKANEVIDVKWDSLSVEQKRKLLKNKKE
jgi:hypothetical protein